MTRDTKNYYSSLLDLEELDPAIPSAAATMTSQEMDRTVLARLFTLDRLDLALQVSRTAGFTNELAEKLGPALRMKNLVFHGLAPSLDREVPLLSPRHLAELELLLWRPSCGPKLRRLLAVEVPVHLDWRRRRVRPDNPAQVVRFYQETEAYIWELMAANNLVQTLFNYSVTLEKMIRLGIREFLDYGAGIGTFIIAASELGLKATHMDLPSKTMGFARWRYELRGLDIPLIEASGMHSDIPPSSAIVCTEVVEHVVDPLALLDGFQEALPVGGHLIVSESCKYLDKFVSHLPSNQWLGGRRFDYELRRRGFTEVLAEPQVHPRVFQKTRAVNSRPRRGR